MSPGPNANNATNPSLSRRALRPVISQAYCAELFIERNDEFWCDEYGFPDRYYAYCRADKAWHVAHEVSGYIYPDDADWRCSLNGEPQQDFRPAVMFDLRRLLAPLLDTASPAEQRRAGSYYFLAGTIRLLEHDPRMIRAPEDFRWRPRTRRENAREYR